MSVSLGRREGVHFPFALLMSDTTVDDKGGDGNVIVAIVGDRYEKPKNILLYYETFGKKGGA
jgi:hypothetical protein